MEFFGFTIFFCVGFGLGIVLTHQLSKELISLYKERSDYWYSEASKAVKELIRLKEKEISKLENELEDNEDDSKNNGDWWKK